MIAPYLVNAARTTATQRLSTVCNSRVDGTVSVYYRQTASGATVAKISVGKFDAANPKHEIRNKFKQLKQIQYSKQR